MSTKALTLTAGCDRRLVACEVSSQRTAEWIIAAQETGRRSDRAPLNLALAIDRSGSMQGEKLRFVQQAAGYLLDQLDERDRVAVVAYNDEVTLVAPGAAVTEQARQELKERIGALRPGGWTDLGGGWLTGCRAVADHQQATGVNRTLLLTDGLANRGITDLEALTHHARELRRRGVTTSTFGVGLDFNEQLLEALAVQGGGHFFFIERPAQIPELFRQELGELLTVVAREAFLNISVPRGVAVEPLGDLPHERDAERLRIFLGDIGAGERRIVYTHVLTPTDAPGASVVLQGLLGYADLDGQTQTATAELAFSYVREAEIRFAPRDAALLQRAGAVAMATAASRALGFERSGQRGAAQTILQQAMAAHAPYLTTHDMESYDRLSDQMGQGLSEEQRKATHFAAYQLRQSRR